MDQNVTCYVLLRPVNTPSDTLTGRLGMMSCTCFVKEDMIQAEKVLSKRKLCHVRQIGQTVACSEQLDSVGFLLYSADRLQLQTHRLPACKYKCFGL